MDSKSFQTWGEVVKKSQSEQKRERESELAKWVQNVYKIDLNFNPSMLFYKN